MFAREGEFGLIRSIKELFGDIDLKGCEGIGDDCAIIPLIGNRSMVITTDMLVEDIHFLREGTPARLLGRKALAVNLSDIAAMGAAPFATLLSIALPAGLDGGWIGNFMEGFHSLSKEHSVPLIGGDTASSADRITISVTAIGMADNAHIKRRNAARAGDTIFVCGTLGDSAQGLADILAGNPESQFALIHNDPRPQIKEGIWLGEQECVHAMMDLSDGLASDLLHILEASGCGAEVSVEMIPRRTDIVKAVTGGEDYVLMFTADPLCSDKLRGDFKACFGCFGYEITPVGTVTPGESKIKWVDSGNVINPDWKGFTHF